MLYYYIMAPVFSNTKVHESKKQKIVSSDDGLQISGMGDKIGPTESSNSLPLLSSLPALPVSHENTEHWPTLTKEQSDESNSVNSDSNKSGGGKRKTRRRRRKRKSRKSRRRPRKSRRKSKRRRRRTRRRKK